MTEDEMKKRARERVQESRPKADQIAISLVDEFFNGTVAVVDYVDGSQNRRDFVYFDATGKINHSTNVEAFIRSFAGRKPERLAMILYGFGGGLALMIVAAVCYLAVVRMPIPDVLSGALTLILGFYFGTVATAREKL